MRIDKCIKFREFAGILSMQCLSENVLPLLESLPCPKSLGRVSVPESLDEISFGQLMELQNVPETEVFTRPAEVILGLTPKDVWRCPALEVIGFAMFAAKEVKRIGEMFDRIPTMLTPEEREAGADKLNFGTFGIVDSYARRMSIPDHDYVLSCVPWLRIWRCMMNDALTAQMQRRLREIYNKKTK